jgi:hypothetical protein
MDLQTILVFILALLTVTLMLVGFYVISVLKELRETIKKSNSILNTVESVTTSVSNPLNTIMGVVSGLTQGFKAVKSITTLSDLGGEEEIEEPKETKPIISRIKKMAKR